jgi:DMSO/TMAO reductase YedYZ molybdopterin-dependent catalytic subunit
LAEAQTTLLATHVGGELLTPGHGAPLRLVAPGRRGFQWVKWVTEIQVLTATDYGQWLAIFTSGL